MERIKRLLIIHLAVSVCLTVTQDGPDTVESLTEEQRACIEQWNRKKPELKKRFKEGQIAWLCSKTKQWVDKALTPQEVSNDDILTPKQLDWIRGLRGCSSLKCLNEIKCKGGKCRKRSGSGTETRRPGFRGRSADNEPISFKRPVPAHFDFTDNEVSSVFEKDDIDTVAVGFLEEQDPRKADFAEATKKQNKRAKIASVCVKVLQPGANARTAFPGFTGRPKQLKQKFVKWQKKCVQMKQRLTAKGRELEDLTEPEPSLDRADHNRFINDPTTPRQSRDRRRLAQLCKRILSTATAEQAFPYFSENHPRAEEGNLAQKYARWHHKCSLIKKRLSAKRVRIDDLARITPPPSGRRRKRDVEERDSEEVLVRNKRQMGDDDFRGIRKEFRMMSEDERQRYQAGMAKLKRDKIDSRSKYDLLTIYHTPQESPGAHWGPAFLPFHRELLKQ